MRTPFSILLGILLLHGAAHNVHGRVVRPIVQGSHLTGIATTEAPPLTTGLERLAARWPPAPPIGSCQKRQTCCFPAGLRQLGRLAKRAVLGMARARSSGSNVGGDHAIAFSTTSRPSPQRFTAGTPSLSRLSEEELSLLFEAAIEATEEAIDNFILRATTVRGRDGHVVPSDSHRQGAGSDEEIRKIGGS
jgi:hypothetical protein